MSTRFLLETKFGSRVKGVSFHPVFPWICASTYVGLIHVWDYESNREIHRFRHPCATKYDEHDRNQQPLLESIITIGAGDGDGDGDGASDTGLPVRCVDFHPKDPLIVSAGDDLNIKLWDCHLRHCLLTFSGHADFIRTVRFHPKADQTANADHHVHTHHTHHLPWILSASDDKTIRIWNYIKRTCLCVIDRGHTDYVMSAEFHPTLDLILTASLDHTLRIWDTSKLIQTEANAIHQTDTTTAPHIDTTTTTTTDATTTIDTTTTTNNHHAHYSNYNHHSTQGSPSQPKQPVTLKFVLEGHQHGVNWAVFHPSLPLIASASDDCHVKLWNFSNDRAWENKTQPMSHHRNVTSCLFATTTTTISTTTHLNTLRKPASTLLTPTQPTQPTPLVVSCSEDGRVCIWDTNDETCIGAFRRNSRFWVLAKHPTHNIMAAGHDSGLIMFKLDCNDNLERSQRFQHDYELKHEPTVTTTRNVLQEILTKIYHHHRPQNPFLILLSLTAWILLLVSISFLPSPFLYYLVVFLVGFVSLLRDDSQPGCGGAGGSNYETFFMTCWIFGGLGMFACRPVGFLIAVTVLAFSTDMFCKWRSASNFANRQLSIIEEETCGDIIDASEEIQLYPM